MTRTSIFILGLAAAISLPTAASANCGTMQGSFIVTCEKGVQVYRHNSLSGMPAPMTRAQAIVKAEQLRAKTAQQQISAQSRNDARIANLRERELAIQDYRARVYDRNTRGRSYYVTSFGNRGFGFARPGSFRSRSRKARN